MNVEKQADSAKKNASSKWGCVGLFALFLVVMLLGAGNDDDKVKQPAQKVTANAPKPQAGGFNCLSKWDGSHAELVKTIKKDLRDPDSFKHVETRLAPSKTPGEFILFMDYRAANGFGGMAFGKLAATLHRDCSFKIEANVTE